MAESADILTSENVRVMLPNIAAGCSMADMADPDDVFAAWDHINEAARRRRHRHPRHLHEQHRQPQGVRGRTRRASSAPPATPLRRFKYAFERGDKVLFFPDQHLGRNTGWEVGIPLDEMVLWNWRMPNGGLTANRSEGEVILWQGHCSTHQRFSVEQIEKARREHPDVRVIVHPETRWEVVQAADRGAPPRRSSRL